MTLLFFGGFVGTVVYLLRKKASTKSLIGVCILGVAGTQLGAFFSNLILDHVVSSTTSLILIALAGMMITMSFGKNVLKLP